MTFRTDRTWLLNDVQLSELDGTWAIYAGPGSMFVWGSNYNGALGINIDPNLLSAMSSPVQIGSATWNSVSVGSNFHTLATKTNGSLWAWGDNYYGELGQGDSGNTTHRSSPVQVGTDTNWISVAAGYQWSLALKSNGTLWAWGHNVHGQLGPYSVVGTNLSLPIQVGSDTDWKSISCGANHTIALKTDNSLWLWGANNVGQLGDGTITDNQSPIQVIGTWVSIGTDSQNSYAIMNDGTLWAWGDNTHGQLGPNSTYGNALSTPTQVLGTTTWNSVSAGDGHVLATQIDNTLWAWGNNYYGQLGPGGPVNYSLSPVQVSGTDWKSVSNDSTTNLVGTGCYDFSLAIKTDGTLWAWGINYFGELGQNDTLGRSSPVQIGSWTIVSGGQRHVTTIL